MSKRTTGNTDRAEVLLASARPDRMDRDRTLPARFVRLLEKLGVAETCRGQRVVIKMHFGGGLGYSTIPPLFVKLLVDQVRKGRPRSVRVVDQGTRGASDRGYTRETLGAPLGTTAGPHGRDVRLLDTGWRRLGKVAIGRPVLEADVLINLAHVKGHGDAGFGGACKNLAMGCVPGATRQKIHALEGRIRWLRSRCTHCKRCLRACPTRANEFAKTGEYRIFWHHCRMCQHCVLACPTGALRLVHADFAGFQEGLARVTRLVLNAFDPGKVLHINVLTNITLFCDCWGMTTPALVPDIGIMAGRDIVAVDRAALDAIRVRDLIPGSLTPPYRLQKGRHLFEKLHGKDPYAQVRAMERLGLGTSRYRLVPVP